MLNNYEIQYRHIFSEKKRIIMNCKNTFFSKIAPLYYLNTDTDEILWNYTICNKIVKHMRRIKDKNSKSTELIVAESVVKDIVNNNKPIFDYIINYLYNRYEKFERYFVKYRKENKLSKLTYAYSYQIGGSLFDCDNLLISYNHKIQCVVLNSARVNGYDNFNIYPNYYLRPENGDYLCIPVEIFKYDKIQDQVQYILYIMNKGL